MTSNSQRCRGPCSSPGLTNSAKKLPAVVQVLSQASPKLLFNLCTLYLTIFTSNHTINYPDSEPSVSNSRAVNRLPNLIAQRLVRVKVRRQLGLLLQHQVRHKPAKHDAALGVQVRVVVGLEVVRVRLVLADGLHELAAVEVEVDVRRLGLGGRRDGALALVGEVVRHDAVGEAAAREGGDEDGRRAEGLDLLGEVAEVGLVLVEGDVLCGLLVVVAELIRPFVSTWFSYTMYSPRA